MIKSKVRWALILALLLVFAIPLNVFAQGKTGDKFIFGGSYTLKSGETLQGDLIVFGGDVTIKEGAQVDGDTTLIGGTLHSSGSMKGDVVIIGGTMQLQKTALVDGDVSLVGGNLERGDGARVTGKIEKNARPPVGVIGPQSVLVPWSQINFNPFWDFLWYFFRSFLWAAVAILMVLFVPQPTKRVAQAVVGQPLISGGLGMLTVVVLPALLIIFTLTLILIPVTLLSVIIFIIAWVFGLVAISIEVGQRLGQALHQDWALPAAAGVGAFILTLITNGIGRIPCIGWTAPVLVGMVGLGAVLLTRFGTQSYPPPDPLNGRGPVFPSRINPKPPVDPMAEPMQSPSEPPVMGPDPTAIPPTS